MDLHVKDSTEALKVTERILSENNRGSMVARRLIWLLGVADVSGMRRVLDIGSWHLGQSVEFANVFSDAKIDAFEPVPVSYQLCDERRNALEERIKNRISVHNVALKLFRRVFTLYYWLAFLLLIHQDQSNYQSLQFAPISVDIPVCFALYPITVSPPFHANTRAKVSISIL